MTWDWYILYWWKTSAILAFFLLIECLITPSVFACLSIFIGKYMTYASTPTKYEIEMVMK